jgi:preprotein translocase subunit SecE
MKAPAKKRLFIFRFMGETIVELKKVTWLSKREAAYLTALVLIVAAAVGIILGVLDLGFSVLVELFVGG